MLISWSYDVWIGPCPGGWRLAVVSRERLEYGPFPTERAARMAEHRTIRRWSDRARELGGYALRLRADEWCVALPEGVEVRGGRRLSEVAFAVSRAGGAPDHRRSG
jgi:hypothetical protein